MYFIDKLISMILECDSNLSSEQDGDSTKLQEN